MSPNPLVVETTAALDAARAAAVRRYRAERRPARFFRDWTQALDAALLRLWTGIFGADSPFSLLAVGGYGRGEMYPHSDVDLALVLPETPDQTAQDKIAALVQALWDTGLSPAVKSGSLKELCESARSDLSADTALLEMRLLCGSREAAQRLGATLGAQRDTASFTEAKLTEMQQRHGRQPAFPLEPDLKNGAGCLRDIHTMLWLAKAQGLRADFYALVRKNILTRSEADLLRDSHRRLARLRIDLHLAAGRGENRLLFDHQSTLAEAAGLNGTGRQQQAERLMHRFYRTAKTVLQLNGILLPMLRGRVYCPLPHIVRETGGGYRLTGRLLDAEDKNLFKRQPEQIFGAMAVWQEDSSIQGLAPDTLRAWWAAVQQANSALWQHPEMRKRFLDLFYKGSGLTRILYFLNLYGVLARCLNGWKNIVGLLQHDLYHIYPVDDHILTVLRNMRRMAVDAHSHELPFAAALMHRFEKKHILYLAALFHDIAKGRNGDHAVLGAQEAARFAAEYGLDAGESELLAWLVESHLLMSLTAQKQDIQDPEVVGRFCSRVGSRERLTALYLLTVADIRGTNPKIWNSWKDGLLQQLFHAAAEQLSGSGATRKGVVSHRQSQALALLEEQGFAPADIRRLWQDLGEAYFVRYDADSILWHLPLLAGRSETPAVHLRRQPENRALQVWLIMPDGERLFTRLCRIFGRHRLGIAAARAYVTAHRRILDTFTLSLPEHSTEDDIRRIEGSLKAELEDFLHGRFTERADRSRPGRRARLLPITPYAAIQPDDGRSGWYTIELAAADRPCLLADITEVFARRRISLAHAIIATLDERAEDSFLVYAPTLAEPAALNALKQDLLAVL